MCGLRHVVTRDEGVGLGVDLDDLVRRLDRDKYVTRAGVIESVPGFSTKRDIPNDLVRRPIDYQFASARLVGDVEFLHVRRVGDAVGEADVTHPRLDRERPGIDDRYVSVPWNRRV